MGFSGLFVVEREATCEGDNAEQRHVSFDAINSAGRFSTSSGRGSIDRRLSLLQRPRSAKPSVIWSGSGRDSCSSSKTGTSRPPTTDASASSDGL